MAKRQPVFRLTNSIYSNPHLISQQAFTTIEAYLDMRNSLQLMKLNPEDDSDSDVDDAQEDDNLDYESGVGMVNIQGSLTYRPVASMCGEVGTSYQELVEDVDQLLDNGARIIIMNCDSGGGEGYGAFETANAIRQMVDDADAKLLAYIDGSACSACYALAVVADEVIANPMAQVGSIGVLVALMNNSQQLKNEGIVRSFVSAGDDKIPFDADGGWKPSFLEDLQNKVNTMYAQFVDHVSMYTGLSTDAIKNTQAKTYLADEALSLGLVNKIMTRADFVNYVASIVPNASTKRLPGVPWPINT